MKKKLISALLLATMAMGLLAGCGQKEEAPAAEEPAEDVPTDEYPAEDVPLEEKCPKCGSLQLKHVYRNGRVLPYCSNDACETRINHPINKELEKQREKAAKAKESAESASE